MQYARGFRLTTLIPFNLIGQLHRVHFMSMYQNILLYNMALCAGGAVAGLGQWRIFTRESQPPTVSMTQQDTGMNTKFDK